MRRRLIICVLCLCACLGLANAEPDAAWPSMAQGTSAAPVARLTDHLIVPPEAVTSITGLCLEKQTMGLAAWMRRPGEAVSALWRYDQVWGLSSLCYEAPRGYQIFSPVLWKGDLYFVQRKEDREAGWEILVHRRQSGRVEVLRADVSPDGALTPCLRTDGEGLYWYESGKVESEAGAYLPVRLFHINDQGAPEEITGGTVYQDGSGPCVRGSVWASGVWDAALEKWYIVWWDLKQNREMRRMQVEGMPVDLQIWGDRTLWRQGEDLTPGEMNGALEEDGLLREIAGDTPGGSRLFYQEAASGQILEIDRGVEVARLWADGIFYVKENGMLYGYTDVFATAFRLSPFGDFTGHLEVEGETLLTLRTIWTGEETLYRPDWIDIAPLREGRLEWM